MFCIKCGNKINEGENFCPNCQNQVESENRNNNYASCGKRIGGIIIDGFIAAFVIFFVMTIINVLVAMIIAGPNISYEARYAYQQGAWNKIIAPIIQIVVPFMIIMNPMIGHTLMMTLFKGSIGNLIFKITIRNADGSEAGRGKFLLQNIINVFFLLLGPIVALVSAIIYCGSKEKQLLSEMILGLRSYSK